MADQFDPPDHWKQLLAIQNLLSAIPNGLVMLAPANTVIVFGGPRVDTDMFIAATEAMVKGYGLGLVCEAKATERAGRMFISIGTDDADAETRLRSFNEQTEQ